MNINKNNNTKIIIVLSIIIVLLVGYGVSAYAFKLWPLTTSEVKTDTGKDETNNNDQPATGDDTDQDDTEPVETPGNTDDSQSVVAPPITPPAQDSGYPIENLHYKIEQDGSKKFSVTLYPISGSDYDLLLKQYKEEVVDYLVSRYGSLNGLTISWIPKGAEDI